jgi:hypothetical protein
MIDVGPQRLQRPVVSYRQLLGVVSHRLTHCSVLWASQPCSVAQQTRYVSVRPNQAIANMLRCFGPNSDR